MSASVESIAVPNQFEPEGERSSGSGRPLGQRGLGDRHRMTDRTLGRGRSVRHDQHLGTRRQPGGEPRPQHAGTLGARRPLPLGRSRRPTVAAPPRSPDLRGCCRPGRRRRCRRAATRGSWFRPPRRAGGSGRTRCPAPGRARPALQPLRGDGPRSDEPQALARPGGGRAPERSGQPPHRPSARACAATTGCVPSWRLARPMARPRRAPDAAPETSGSSIWPVSADGNRIEASRV